MIVKAEFHTSFVQIPVLYPFSSVTTNVATESTLNVKCQRFGINTDRYLYQLEILFSWRSYQAVGLQCLLILSLPQNPQLDIFEK
jgi:hypothetical protein